MKTNKFIKLFILALLSAVLASSCGSEYPEEIEGKTISGKIFYKGGDMSKLKQPLLQVALFATFPPSGPPHGSITIMKPDAAKLAEGGVEYQIKHIPPYKYFVFAQIVESGSAADGTGIAGAYPNVCAVFSLKEGNVEIEEDKIAKEIDFTLYDTTAQDPCFENAQK